MLTARIDSFPKISIWLPSAPNPASRHMPAENSATYVIPTIFISAVRYTLLIRMQDWICRMASRMVSSLAVP